MPYSKEELEVESRILALLNHENKQPHLFLLDNAFADLMNRFNNLALRVMETHEATIAERLALFTPERERSKVIRQISTIFPRSTLANLVANAFTLQRNTQLLLGPNPENFFTSRDFSRELCLEFSYLFDILKGHENEIGLRLSQIKSIETRKTIEHRLELLTTTAFEQANPFQLIMNAMFANTKSVISNPNTLFGRGSASQSPTEDNMDKTMPCPL